MGGLFSTPIAPEVPKPITPENTSLEAQKAIAAQKKREQRRRGYASTLLMPNLNNSTLLGG